MEIIQYPSMVIIYILLILFSLLFCISHKHVYVYGIVLGLLVFALIILGLYYGISYYEFLLLFLPSLLLVLGTTLKFREVE